MKYATKRRTKKKAAKKKMRINRAPAESGWIPATAVKITRVNGRKTVLIRKPLRRRKKK